MRTTEKRNDRSAHATHALSACSAICISIVVLGACSAPQVEVEEQALTSVSSSVPAAHRLLSQDASSTIVQTYWPEFSDFDDFAELADLVFVGRLTSVVPSVGQDRGDAEDVPQQDGPVITFDGLSFTVVRVLDQSSPVKVGDAVTIGQPVTHQVSPEAEEVAIKLDPIDVLRGGIEAVDRGEDGPLYVVFANEGRYFGGETSYTFMGAGSVAPIDKDGSTIVETGHPPFSNLAVAVNGLGVPVTLDLIELWIREGRPEGEPIPPEFWPKPEDAPEKPSPELVTPED